MTEITEIQAVLEVAEELSDLFWLIFWYGLFGVFKSEVDNRRS